MDYSINLSMSDGNHSGNFMKIYPGSINLSLGFENGRRRRTYTLVEDVFSSLFLLSLKALEICNIVHFKLCIGQEHCLALFKRFDVLKSSLKHHQCLNKIVSI